MGQHMLRDARLRHARSRQQTLEKVRTDITIFFDWGRASSRIEH